MVFGAYKVDGDTGQRLAGRIIREASWVWELNRQFVQEPRSPESYEALVLMRGVLMFFSRSEKLMTAGWQAKEVITTVYFPRWHRGSVDRLLKDEDCAAIPISALMPNNREKLGEIYPDADPPLYLNAGSYEDIERDVAEVAAGRLAKTGCLLWGAPGNGKTQFAKYLSKKYKLPINVVYLNPSYDNYLVARMFADVPPRCIVLLEDFDNYFDGRTCIMKNDEVRFTFDSFINALDGIHNDYRGVVFIMTANDISKVDPSVKCRPSRFKHVREFVGPNWETRMRVLGDERLAFETDGSSLDDVFKRASEK